MIARAVGLVVIAVLCVRGAMAFAEDCGCDLSEPRVGE